MLNIPYWPCFVDLDFIFRAIDIQALIGNVGGYIGLCLGYSILQIPDFVVFILCKAKMNIFRIRNRILKMDSRTIFVTNEDYRDNEKSNNDLNIPGTDTSILSAPTRTDMDKMYTIIKKLEQKIALLEKSN